MSKKGLPYRKDAGFKVPENYFQNFESRFMKNLPSPKEDSLLPQSSSPYKIPDTYFKQFESRLTEELGLENKDPKVIRLFTRKHLSYVAGIAAVLAVIFSSLVFNRAQTFDYNDLDMLAVENYLLESLEGSNPEEFREGDFSFATSPNANLDQEALLEYLSENIEDPSLLLNEE